MSDALVPAGDYALSAIINGEVHIAGMTPKEGRTLVATGRLGAEVDVAQGQRLAAIAAERAITAAQEAAREAGSALAGSARVTVYVAVADSFTAISEVADGASPVWREHLGTLPARAAVGVTRLPGNAPIEIVLTASLQLETALRQ
ncbi:RidA family protein [Streptomyces hygroscopicus subsp. hygroscopicus]|uniref:RidA family protein n=1 Tax=Streptomyces TaxID=1883 RepID=UPI001C65D23B|nr:MULTISPECIES: RidA family protein [Streptomyces]MBW8088882.1 RidA family protein [Streptomyces hygroscopicus subsp. hygroscopicus]MCO8308404.1 RidA family protein [Streptomyces sp. RKCA744]MDN3060044.1 RidA family protein [Streptomyces sp. SRF1]